MKQVKGLGGWIRSAIWLELIIPGYFFGKTFGTADAKFRFLDQFMYPPLFINICGYFRDLPVGHYTGRFLGMLAGAVIGVLCALLIGVFYKWVLKDWAYSKAARIGSMAFILFALMTGFMSDMFNESIGMGLRIEVQMSLGNALKEMRAIAAGVGLPQLAELSLTETVVRAVHSHQRRTSTEVALTLQDIPDRVALPVRITAYRLIQEALNNSFRHGGGAGQRVHVRGEGKVIAVEISDNGPGFQLELVEGKEGHLGIAGMRERVESLGGRFSIESQPGEGTKVSALLPCEPEGDDLS